MSLAIELSYRANPGIFIGFSNGQIFTVSKDVIFREEGFPFLESHNDNVQLQPISSPAGTKQHFPVVRRSTRNFVRPTWLKDYIFNYHLKNETHLIEYIMAPSTLSFICNATQEKEPRSYNEAKADPIWVEAMRESYLH